MKRFVPSTQFKKNVKKVPKKVLVALKTRIEIFEENIFEDILNNHKLQGKYKDCRSINITGDWRLIYKDLGDGAFLLVDVDTHSNLYG